MILKKAKKREKMNSLCRPRKTCSAPRILYGVLSSPASAEAKTCFLKVWLYLDNSFKPIFIARAKEREEKVRCAKSRWPR